MGPRSTSTVGGGGAAGHSSRWSAGGQGGEPRGTWRTWGWEWPPLGTQVQPAGTGLPAASSQTRCQEHEVRGWREPPGQGLGSTRWQRAGTGLSALRGPETKGVLRAEQTQGKATEQSGHRPPTTQSEAAGPSLLRKAASPGRGGGAPALNPPRQTLSLSSLPPTCSPGAPHSSSSECLCHWPGEQAQQPNVRMACVLPTSRSGRTWAVG